MKRFISIFTFLTLSLVLKSQVVFFPEGATWKSAFLRHQTSSDLEIVQYTGTLSVGSETVKVISHRRFFIFGSDDKNELSYIKQLGDTIYIKNLMTSNNWQVLYNFAATVGQSWTNNLVRQLATSNYTTVVNSVQTVTINGQS